MPRPPFSSSCNVRRPTASTALCERPQLKSCPIGSRISGPPRRYGRALCRACIQQSTEGEQRQALERLYGDVQPYTTAELFQLAAQSLLGPSGHSNGENGHTRRPPWLVHAVQVGGPPKPPKSKEDRQEDFYANVGTAIRTLREDVPTCLKMDLNYDIYREDITFRDPKNAFYGLDNYKLIFWSLRFHGRLFFKELYVEVKRIWQKDDNTICLRWTVHGFPRLPWDQEGTFDGVSTYTLDCHGKIYEHRVNNVIMSDSPMQRLPFLVRLNLTPTPEQQPYPTPCQGQQRHSDSIVIGGLDS